MQYVLMTHSNYMCMEHAVGAAAPYAAVQYYHALELIAEPLALVEHCHVVVAFWSTFSSLANNY